MIRYCIRIAKQLKTVVIFYLSCHNRAVKASQEMKDPLESPEHQEVLDFPDLLDLPESPESQGVMDSRVAVDYLEILENQ